MKRAIRACKGNHKKNVKKVQLINRDEVLYSR